MYLRERICSDNFTCRHTEIQVADPTFYLTQSQYTDTGPTSPSADPITPDARQGSRWGGQKSERFGFESRLSPWGSVPRPSDGWGGGGVEVEGGGDWILIL